MRPAGGGKSVADHMAAVRRSKGGSVAKAAPEPTLDPGLQYLWRAWMDLNLSRGSSGFGPLGITHLEMEAWSRLHQTPLRAWEVRLLRETDLLYMKSVIPPTESA